jgi:hypothetical protein
VESGGGDGLSADGRQARCGNGNEVCQAASDPGSDRAQYVWQISHNFILRALIQAIGLAIKRRSLEGMGSQFAESRRLQK